jgi:hypothetical protein
MEDIFLVLFLILIIWIIFVADLINDHSQNHDIDETDLSASDVQENFHVHGGRYGRYGYGRYRGYGRYGYGGYAYGLPYGYNYVDDYYPWWGSGWYSPWTWWY